jgi:predicted Co/Zn/Cd cation transporter (cation efflux family)
MSGQVPEWLLTTSVAVTVFTAVFCAGLGIALDELRWIWDSPGPMFCAMIIALISVPLSIVVLDHVYSAHASIAPWHVAP